MVDTIVLPRRKVVAWVLVALLILLQWGLFHQKALREVIPYSARYCDQCAYLTLSQETYQVMQDRGPLKGVKYGLTRPCPNGCLLHVIGSLSFLVFGTDRTGPLAVNFFHFAAFQIALVGTLHWLTKRWSIAFAGLGLLLAALVPHQWIGGWLDFRIDFIAFNVFGLFLCAVVRSEFFASGRWSLVAGGACALLGLYRYIAVVYLTGILCVSLVFVAVAWCLRRRDRVAQLRLGRQFTGLILTSLIFGIALLPFLFHNFECLWNYYVANHILGAEKNIRATEAGVFTSLDSYLYYAKTVGSGFAGWHFIRVSLALCVTAAAFCAARGLERRAQTPDLSVGPPVTAVLSTISTSRPAIGLVGWFILGACFCVPYAILTANTVKAGQVAGLLVAPLVWLLVLPLAQEAPEHGRWSSIVLTCVVLVAVSMGLSVQLRESCMREPLSQHPEDLTQLTALHDTIVRHCIDNKISHPRLATDCCCELFWFSSIGVRAFEHHGQSLQVVPTLGHGIMAVDETQALAALSQSDFVILTAKGIAYASPAYPFHQSMESLRPRLKVYCDHDMLLLRKFKILDADVMLYARDLL